MKNKGLLLVLVVCFLFVGCSNKENNIRKIEYKLNISTFFEEKITAFLPKNAYKLAKENKKLEQGYTSIDYRLLYEDINSIFSNHDEFYVKNIDKNSSNVKVDLKYNYIEEDFVYSNYITNCFENYNVSSNKDSFEIYLSGKFYCLDDGYDIDIKVSSIFDVKDSNGVLDGDTYVWNINEDNKDSVDISYVISRNYDGMVKDRDKVNNISNNKDKDNGNIIKLAVLVGILVVLFVFKKKLLVNSNI